jgi:multiple sugar transport system permease protein
VNKPTTIDRPPDQAATPVEPAVAPRRKRGGQRGQRLQRFALGAPALTIIIVASLGITTTAIYLVTHTYNLVGSQGHWIGWDNLDRLIHDPLILGTLRVTAEFVVGALVLELVVGTGIALLLQHAFPGRRLVRSLILIPMVVSPIVVGLTWRMLLDPSAGLVNYFLGHLGLGEKYAFLANRHTALAAVVIVDFWQWTPFIVIVVLAGLEALEHEPFEAARVDGANAFQTLRYVTLPMLRPVLAIATLLRTVDAIKSFPLIYTMTNGGPGTTTMTTNLYAYRSGFVNFNLSYASTIGLAISVITTIILIPIATRLLGFRRAK